MKRQPDGSLDVTFRGGGRLEMAWHLCCWGDKVEVIASKDLADLVAPIRRSWPGMP
jgi:predicted DNA-binding transcriptional regulator YafY